MGIYKGSTYLGGLYKNNEYIGEVYKGSDHIASMGFPKTVSGQSPLSLPDARAKNTSWKIEGKTVQPSRLPSGYTELEYLQSSGSQWIDTGINPSGKKIGAVIDFQFTSTSSKTGGIFGSNKTDGTDNCQLTVYTSKWRIKINSYAIYGTTYDTSRHTAKTNMPDGTSLDSTVYTSTQYTIASSNNLNCFLGACNYGSGATGDYTLVGKLYSAKVYNDTTLVRDFIPAKNSSNVLGMYDLVTGQFFTNAGSGAFTAGPELPNPSNPLEIKAVGDSGLPSGYKKLEYIESTGSGTNISYIDTLYTPTINTKARVKFSPIKASGIGFFGSRLDTSNARFCCTTFTSGAQFAFAMTNKTWSNNKTNITLGNIYDVTVYNGKQIVNGTEKTESTISSFSTTCTFKLAPVDNTGTPTGGDTGTSTDVDTKFYLCQIWENDVLAMNLVPAKNSSNVVGMYDLVNGQFFTNAGTGTFIAGPEDTSCVVPVKVSGKNLFDSADMTIGEVINADGSTASSTMTNHSNYIAVEPNTTYTVKDRSLFSSGANQITRYHAYGSDKSWLSQITSKTVNTTNQDFTVTFTTPANCYFVRFTTRQPLGNQVIMLVEGSTAPTVYEPYIAPTTYNINLDAPLQKISTYTDSIESDGTLTRALGVKVFTGSADENWVYDSAYSRFYIPISDLADCSPARSLIGLCSHYEILSDQRPIAQVTTGQGYFGPMTTSKCLLVHDSRTSVSAFKTWLASNNIVVVYPKATATESSVAVPTIATAKGNNYLDVETEIAPSNVEATYVSRLA